MSNEKKKIMPDLIRIKLNSKKIEREVVDSEHPLKFYAGRALSSKIIADEVPPLSDPLGPDNKMIFACGFLSGTTAPNSGRISIGAKSPLTKGIKESNVGGRTPALLVRNNIRALVLEEQSPEWVIIKVSDGNVEILDGKKYVGLNNYKLTKTILDEYGSKVGAFMIATGGELQFANSSVASIDMEGYPSRHAGRGGLGSVMGSKKVKAIVVISPSQSLMQYANQEAFKPVASTWFKALNIANKETKHVFGTPGCLLEMNEMHGLPTQNYRRGQFKDAEKIGGEAVHELIVKNKGKYGLACSPGCAIQCSNMILDSEGTHITSSFEYETIGLLGSNLLISDLEKIAQMDKLCDDFGIDTIETGSCLGVLMDAGKIEWGDADRCIELIEGLREKKSESLDLGLGVYELGMKLGHSRIPHVKHQAFPSYEPRSLKAPSITFVTGPMGADHTAGDVSGENPNKSEGKVAISKEKQIHTMIVDSFGICYFVGANSETTAKLSKLVSARYGDTWDKNLDEWTDWAKSCIIMERDFNVASGLAATDTLPKFMLEEKLEEAPFHWDFNPDEIAHYWDDFN
ncbi:aldehyde ferredoxin oxidoreductase C-terminal domain-containing protein [Promethearchaeum syntrophicum]|uniref:Aldehyde ferredoxin oxidoreductase C-terminal domain-containing protein n=1 Tax=Promethearchaeum syntrophicum TaxID=2594042 RepID=A0A5B9D8J9_9ARCH|nr:aldehyde ferredoxin oxidoreductase C-terminal domain-containing protein [Candidatus Prometheoarchaeum syntrophicum]QEE15588.1 Tungsten-containing aldehyde ferredoxin oxidoreductase [Candidatus Prometheoarchaeum syntrophicum]